MLPLRPQLQPSLPRQKVRHRPAQVPFTAAGAPKVRPSFYSLDTRTTQTDFPPEQSSVLDFIHFALACLAW
jgi:hypothetical protein